MPWVASWLALMFPTAIMPTSMSRAPMTKTATTARMIARGAYLRGLFVSSASEPAVSKP